jgi:hypothetical protein
MLRGDISNRPAAIIAVDYRILLEERRGYAWFVKMVPELLLHKGFENTMKKALPWRPGAKLWLETYWEKRFAVFTVNVPIISRAIDMIVGDVLAETFHFHDRYEFRRWTQINRALGRVYTNDPLLLGLDELVQPHSGWSEEV